MLDEAAAEILIVDDTPANLKLLTNMLTEQGYRVRPASSGALALRSVAVKAPDLILLNVRMPDLDGYAVCQQLKADPHTHSIPVIFISALNEATDKVQGFAAGGVDYVTKPFEPVEVLARVRTHLELWRLQQRLEQCVEARIAELIETHRALQKSEERLRLVIEATRDGVWDWNPQTGDMFFSDRWYTMLGYAPGELVASYASWRDRVHPDDLAAAEATVQAHWDDRLPEFSMEYRMRAKSGDWIWINSRGKVTEWDASGDPLRIVGTNVDITKRKRAEKALWLAQLCIMRTSDAVFWITPDGRFIDVNEQACHSLGYTRAELLTMAVWDIDPSFPREKWAPHWKQTRQLKKRHFETWHQRKDGAVFPVEVTANHVEYEGEEYDFAFVRDITERQRAEEDLRASEHKFRTVVQTAQAITFILDCQGVFLLSEGQGLARLGLAPGQVAGLSVFELYKDYPSIVDNIRKALAGELTHVNNVLGDVVFDTVYSPYSDSDGQPSGVIGIAVDITERKRAEEALQASETFLNTIIEYSPISMWISDDKGTLIRMNQTCRDLLRVTDADLVGKYNVFKDSIVEQQGVMPLVKRVFEQSERVRFILRYDSSQLRSLRLKETNQIILDVTISPILDTQKRVIHAIIQHVDITERQRVEEELQRYREHLEELVTERTAALQQANADLRQAMTQLVQAEKLAALGNLVAGVAHELNTPLGNARLVASTLAEHLHEFAAAVETGALRRSHVAEFLNRSQEAVDLLERNTTRAADLIGHFKQVAVDQTSMRRRDFNLRQTVEEVLMTLQPLFRRSAHRIEVEIPPDLELDSYPGPLEQVLANLISNSLTHGFAGMEAGCIQLQAQPLDITRLQLRYKDNGVGIPTATLNRIFEPFFTTRLGQGGSGLGLYIVYTLITGALGGTIQAHSQPGHGVVFTLDLPTVAPAP